MTNELLIFIPTYNERENVQSILEQILSQNIAADILFVDDNSPDGTGQLLDQLVTRHPNVSVLHRSGKLGIGSAHVQGISYAYEKKYKCLVTMDCDFTHSPSYIHDFIAKADDADIVVGSRYLQEKSLGTWNAYRKLLTRLGHFLTVIFLKMPYDATGAFRLYRLDRLPQYFLDPVQSRGYSFFFESLYILHLNGYRIVEIPTHLPARVYGHSKMRLKDMVHSVSHLANTYLTTLLNIERYEIAEPYRINEKSGSSLDTQGWDDYWMSKSRTAHAVYDLIAAFYRKFIIRPSLNHVIFKYFGRQSRLLHAGCGSGQVDRDIGEKIPISALDISPYALGIYKKANKHFRDLILGSIFAIPVVETTYDGIYNLGVMEHFSEQEIAIILGEFNRVLKPGGTLVLFWPPEFGLSVIVLKCVHFVLNRVMKRNISLHPPEISRVRSKNQVIGFLAAANFTLTEYRFGIRDLFTYVQVVATKNGAVES